jgi:formamidopyrimidine-DNA glycosylase
MTVSLSHSVRRRHTGGVPELLEIEIYRREMADLVGRMIDTVRCPDPWYIRRAGPIEQVVPTVEGRRVTALRRHGKLLLVDLIDGSAVGGPAVVVLGLRFGMTGRPVVDERRAVLTLEYAPAAVRDEWVRFEVGFEGGGRLRMVDPRRLGGVDLNPDVGALGPDATIVTVDELVARCRSSAAIKAVLLDQSRVAGLGNMLVDEVLWRASIDPACPAASLELGEVVQLQRTIVETLPELMSRGGSHLGELSARLRRPGARCPRDGAEMMIRQVGGRTTYSCPLHQRRT